MKKISDRVTSPEEENCSRTPALARIEWGFLKSSRALGVVYISRNFPNFAKDAGLSHTKFEMTKSYLVS